MKFSEMSYKRVEFEPFKAEFDKVLASFEAAKDKEAALSALKSFYSLCDCFYSMANLCYIRYTMDTADEYYSAEHGYYDENGPRFSQLFDRMSAALLSSPLKGEIEGAFGSLLFKNLELEHRAMDEKIVGDMAEENRLDSEYTKLIASGLVEFDGKTMNLSQLGYYMDSPDRGVRKAAYQTFSLLLRSHATELDRIYDDLVKVRTREAAKLGFKNFVELGYLRMTRNCFDAGDVKRFRESVKSEIVPLTAELSERQRRRLGYDKLYYYDVKTLFADGNPRPSGTPKEILEKGGEMFRALSPETGKFMDFMLESELFDVEPRKGKATGGYTEMIPDYKAPFVFINDNGTSEDVNTLAHECGHAFQFYQSKDIYPPVLSEPTYETAEVHSMSMEFLTWPWMELFFGGRADKYRYKHIVEALYFLPYGCMVDEFQHIVYENPSLTPKERNDAWRELERTYQPQLDYGDDPYFGQGTRWQRQHHIYERPFYYIDYCLAQTCALEFFALAQSDRGSAMAKYQKLCTLGGTGTFVDLIEGVGLMSPFEPGCLKSVAKAAKSWIDGVDGE